ncbi:imm11 family protein [Vibrio bivalvicida]|uniref:Imm11 family protein n=1 Tax=Vibrio bivalvicida TaxID=1276888 RepID=A0ABV4MPW5_9VIBR
MNYYLLFSKFEEGEGSFTVQEPWDGSLNFYDSKEKLFKKEPYVLIDQCYDERGMSDCLKVGVGFLVNRKVQKVFFEHGFTGIQFVPVEVENDGLYHDYAFMNATASYDFLEPIASEASRFNKRLGVYRNVYEERLDRDKVSSTDIFHDCFTLSNYKVPYYVSEQVKDALESENVTGIEFIPMEFA